MSVIGREVEVPEKAKRRAFTAEYKRQILREADACKEPGAIGALLRREGLYSSHMNTWRAQRERGELTGLAPKKRGRRAAEINPLAKRVTELERENARLKRRVEVAEGLVEVQKKVAALLGRPIESEEK